MESKTISFQFAGIQEIEFWYKNQLEIPEFQREQHPSNVSAGVIMNYRWNLEENIFGVMVDLKYAFNRNEERFEILKFSAIVEFNVNNLSEILTVKEDNNFIMERQWEVTFVSLALSTARGMLFSRTSGTIYNQYIFPVMNPNQLIVSEKNKQNK